jgi:membrane protein implicated in regulation of membrane protease activity
MNSAIDILDVVALTEDLPERGLYRGQVGTVVEALATDAFEVEFSDEDGRAYASLALNANQLLVLHYEPVEAG